MCEDSEDRNECPLSPLFKCVHEYNKVLELYYHCKLCSEPQAYLELSLFLEHVEETHPDYYRSQNNEALRKQEAETSRPSKKIKIEEGIELHISIGDIQNVSPISKSSVTMPMIKEEPTSKKQRKTFTQSVLRRLMQEGGRSGLEQEDDKDSNSEETEMISVNTSDLSPAQTVQKDSRVTTYKSLNVIKDPHGAGVLALTEEDIKELDELENSQDTRFTTSTFRDDEDMTSYDDEYSNDAESMNMTKETEDDSQDGRPRCNVCSQKYKPKHAKTCQRPHTSEKPSCDAYVCVKAKTEPVYPCPFCTRLFLNKDELTRHVVVHEEEQKDNMKCSVCQREFSSIVRLMHHLTSCNVGQPVECPTCQKSFSNRKNMLTHATNIHFMPLAHVCDDCGKSFNCRSNLVSHQRLHTGEKPYSCEVCGLTFRSRPNLLRHSLKHTSERPFPCSLCDGGFADKSTLQRHVAIVHSEQRMAKRRECPHCDKILKSERQLVKHLQMEHADKEPEAGYRCNICDKLFRERHNMESHRMIHTGERPFPCPKCGKTFRKNSDLTIHYRIHTGNKPFKCEYCGAGFTTNSNLTKHRMSHTGEKPHKCKVCERSFTDKSHLNRHMLTHTGEKPHICEVCDRGFATRAQIKQHMLVHTGEKPFICGACGKAFRQKAKAQRHRCLWKVIQKPGESSYPVRYMDDTTGETVLVMADEDSSQQQVAYRLVEEGEQPHDGHVSYHVIEGGVVTGANTGAVVAAPGDRVVTLVQPGTAVLSADGQEIAYQIVDESGQAVADEQVAAQVINQLTSGAAHVTETSDSAQVLVALPHTA